jgi:hypothetical protein
MAHLTKELVSLGGLAPTFAAAAGGGDTFDPDADTMLVVKNGGGASITVTIATPKVDPKTGLAEADAGGSVPNAGERWFGPFPYETFADPANQGRASIAYSGVTSVTVRPVGLPRLS